MDIGIDDLSDGQVASLLRAHLQEMHKYSPPDSVHALDESKLTDPAVTFWSARINGQLAGCGALKQLSADSAEIKSMKTDTTYLRQGVAARLLSTIITEAKRRGYKIVSLETGTNDAFLPAVALYQRTGFIECGPFGDYKPDPFSRFFSLRLTEHC